MGKSPRGAIDDESTLSRGYGLTLTFEGKLAEDGQLPAAELGAALQGWDRLLQLAVYSHESATLAVPKSGTGFRVEFRVRRVSKGSFLVDAMIFVGLAAAAGITGNRADAVVLRVWKWASTLVKTHIRAKRNKGTLDAVVDDIEAVAQAEDIRPSKNREESEDFVTALNSALDNATVPLDSSAGREILSLKGKALDIVIDEAGRTAIRAAFDPPTLDPEADDVIDAPVKFIRINRHTGKGLLEFVRPADESQLGHQRFHAEDRAIRRRANQYTGAFHHDVPLMVKMQRKAYAVQRHGHYWLIVGASEPEKTQGLFGPVDESDEPRKKQKQKRKGKDHPQ